EQPADSVHDGALAVGAPAPIEEEALLAAVTCQRVAECSLHEGDQVRLAGEDLADCLLPERASRSRIVGNPNAERDAVLRRCGAQRAGAQVDDAVWRSEKHGIRI